MGANGIARYLENHGIHKLPRQNGKNTMFIASYVRNIIQNPVYCGKIAYGRHRTEKVHGTRNDYHLVKRDDYLLVDGLHEGIVSEELWEQAQIKVKSQAKKYEHVNREKGEKVSAENVYKTLVFFDELYDKMSDKEKRAFYEKLIKEVNVHEERQPNGQWLKSIVLRLLIIEHNMTIRLDNGSYVETVVCLSKGDVKSKKIRVEFSLEDMDTDGFKQGATYNAIRDWIKEKYGYRVTNLNIVQVKQKYGIIEQENYNKPKSSGSKQLGCPEEKIKAIENAMRHFQMI